MRRETGKAVGEICETVDAPPEIVWRALLNCTLALSADRLGALSAHEGPGPYVIRLGTPGSGLITIEIDPREYSIAMQGEWWYRGVHCIEPGAQGCLVRYRFYNVAPLATRWMAALAQAPQHRRGMQATFDKLIRDIRAQIR